METRLPMDTETSEALEVELSLRADIRRVESTLRDRIDETQRRTNVLFESLRGEIRMIAEAVVSVDAKIGSIESKVGSLDAKVGALHAKVGALDAKVDALWRTNLRR